MGRDSGESVNQIKINTPTFDINLYASWNKPINFLRENNEDS